jgi:hypothetical protein
MSVPKSAAILALTGLVGFLAMMVAHANETAVSVLFYGATICFTLAAIILLAYVAVKFWEREREVNSPPAGRSPSWR